MNFGEKAEHFLRPATTVLVVFFSLLFFALDELSSVGKGLAVVIAAVVVFLPPLLYKLYRIYQSIRRASHGALEHREQ